MTKKEILEYAKNNNIKSRFYIISIDIGNKQLIKDLIGGNSTKEIPNWSYAVKDFATGKIVSPVEESLKITCDFLHKIRRQHNEEKCCVLFFDDLKTIEDLKKELKDEC